MAERYGAGISRSGINTADSAYFNLDQTGTSKRLRVRQVIVNIGVAPTTAPALYLTRATARGTQSSTLLGQAFDTNAPAAIGTLDVCGTGGSVPSFTAANKIGVGGLAVTAGGTFVWSFFDDPIIVAATSGLGLIVANANASGATTGTWYCSMFWDE